MIKLQDLLWNKELIGKASDRQLESDLIALEKTQIMVYDGSCGGGSGGHGGAACFMGFDPRTGKHMCR